MRHVAVAERNGAAFRVGMRRASPEVHHVVFAEIIEDGGESLDGEALRHRRRSVATGTEKQRDGRENAARKAGRFRYQPIVDMPPKSYDRIQIVTSYEIIDGAKIDSPPTMQAVKRFRRSQTEMFKK